MANETGIWPHESGMFPGLRGPIRFFPISFLFFSFQEGNFHRCTLHLGLAGSDAAGPMVFLCYPRALLKSI